MINMKKVKMKIKRKDGITYTREVKQKECDCQVTFRYSREKLDLLRKITISKGIKYNTLIKELIDGYIDEHRWEVETDE